ncbi:thioesterase II family protein [Nocardia sp. NPDC060256]|uniref:thioesterase II family protein n=1 Tax=unclassified Nocardia TaxID=2637762 RepID=UPI003652D377
MLTAQGAQSARYLLRKPSEDARARIFCFPYSGVGASMFNQWPRWIDEVEICPVQLPARENRIREPHFGTFQALAAELAPALAPHLDRPFAFFGHCAGALPAFETVRRLADLGAPAPRRLVMSAQVAPHDCPHDRFLELSDAELTDELARLTIARGGRPHPTLIELTLAVLRQDLAANRAYHLDRPTSLAVGITVLHWRQDTEVTPAELAGWRHYSPDVRFVALDGGHYGFLSAPPPLMSELARAAGS